MIGDPLSIDQLFPAQGESPVLFCQTRITGLTNTGVASYSHGKTSRMSRTGPSLIGPLGLEGGGISTFSDRTYEVEREPTRDRNTLRTPNDNGLQRFSTREKEWLLWRITGPHPLQEIEFQANLYFGSQFFGPGEGDPMPVPLARQGNFLIGSTKLIRGDQTTFSFAFFEYPILVP